MNSGLAAPIILPFGMAASGIGAALKFHAHPLAQVYVA